MREITRRVSFGMGVRAQERVDHPVLDKIRAAEFAPQRKLAQSQLGTVGSRLRPQDRIGLPRAGPRSRFRRGGAEGERTSRRWELAGEYAYADRDVVVDNVLEILGAEAVHEVHNHHNLAWREEDFGRSHWLVRKGCTPARPGQEGFVGGSMGDESVILEGVASPDADESLHSTVHGAGRMMSRTQAAGRVRRRKRFACSHRDCDRIFDIDGISSTAGVPKHGVCPDHPTSRVRKAWIEEQLEPGRRGAGGVQAPAGRLGRARRDDPGEAHAPPARRRDGWPRRARPVQGRRAAKAASAVYVPVRAWRSRNRTASCSGSFWAILRRHRIEPAPRRAAHPASVER